MDFTITLKQHIMAINDSIFKLRGRLGDLIFYQRGGQNFVRSAPVTVKQTANTKQAANDFGNASKAACVLRRAIDANFYTASDRGYVNRLNSVMGSILRADSGHTRGKFRVTDQALEQLQHFRINSFAPMRVETHTRRYYDGTVAVTVELPHLQIPKGADYIQYRAVVLSPDFGLRMCKTAMSDIIAIKPTHDGSPIVLEVPAVRDRNAIVILEVMSFANGHHARDKRWNVLEVVAVLRPVKRDTPERTFDMREGFNAAPVHHPGCSIPLVPPLDS